MRETIETHLNRCGKPPACVSLDWALQLHELQTAQPLPSTSRRQQASAERKNAASPDTPEPSTWRDWKVDKDGHLTGPSHMVATDLIDKLIDWAAEALNERIPEAKPERNHQEILRQLLRASQRGAIGSAAVNEVVEKRTGKLRPKASSPQLSHAGSRPNTAANIAKSLPECSPNEMDHSVKQTSTKRNWRFVVVAGAMACATIGAIVIAVWPWKGETSQISLTADVSDHREAARHSAATPKGSTSEVDELAVLIDQSAAPQMPFASSLPPGTLDSLSSLAASVDSPGSDTPAHGEARTLAEPEVGEILDLANQGLDGTGDTSAARNDDREAEFDVLGELKRLDEEMAVEATETVLTPSQWDSGGTTIGSLVVPLQPASQLVKLDVPSQISIREPLWRLRLQASDEFKVDPATEIELTRRSVAEWTVAPATGDPPMQSVVRVRAQLHSSKWTVRWSIVAATPTLPQIQVPLARAYIDRAEMLLINWRKILTRQAEYLATASRQDGLPRQQRSLLTQQKKATAQQQELTSAVYKLVLDARRLDGLLDGHIEFVGTVHDQKSPGSPALLFIGDATDADASINVPKSEEPDQP